MNMNKMPSMPELAPKQKFAEVIIAARQRVVAGALAVDESKSQVPPMAVPLADVAIERVERNDYGLAA